jgi:phage portal protein BeeE
MVRIEHSLSGLMQNPRYMKFNANAMLRGDLTARYDAYSTGITTGFILPDEARAWEDLPPLKTSPDAPDMGDGADPASTEVPA